MPKYKIGDYVKVLNGSKIEDYTGSWNSNMEFAIGHTYKIANCYKYRNSPYVAYELDGEDYIWDERGLELVTFSDYLDEKTTQSIVIYIDPCNPKTVVAAGFNGLTASARCCPEDDFDFSTGAKLAF